MLCEECEEEMPRKRWDLGFKICVSCQEELEASGEFQKHKMEIYQELSGWQCDGVRTKFIRGGRK